MKSAFVVNAFSFAFVLLIVFVQIEHQNACPFQVRAFCACVDHVDGVQLNCTAPAERTFPNGSSQLGTYKIGKQQQRQKNGAEGGAVQLMQVLRNSQTHLGLLKVLTIHSTSINVLTNNFFKGLYIRRLELVNCEIEVLEKGALGGLESVLQELAITGNRMKEIVPETIAGFHSLVRLDLSNNSIEELKAEHSLPRMPKLTDIDLSHNRIPAVHKTFFDGVKGTLQTINLGHNVIEEVPASAIRGFRMLMALHLHSNRLHGTLPALSFMNLPVLSLLNLAGNQISFIHRQAFLNAPMLRYLYLSANRLTQIQPFQLSSFERLEMLDLSNNWIEVLENDSFAGLPSLRQLYLGENHIKSIESFAFSQNSSIAVLILEQNWLTEVTKDSFRWLKQIQQLSLKSNKIRSVDVAAFQGCPSLVMLDLSRNELIDLSPGTFLSQLNLLLVDLSFNKIVRTPFGAFGRRIATVLLQENPLVCVEQIHMLQQGTGVLIPNNEDAICGKSLTTVSTIKATTNLDVQQPIPGDKIDDGNLEDTDDEAEVEESAFVQQLNTVPPRRSSDELAETVHPTTNGHKMDKRPNIRPIQIGWKTPVVVSSSSASAEGIASQKDQFMTTIATYSNTANELGQFSADANEFSPLQTTNKNKMISSAPIPLNENIGNSEAISYGTVEMSSEAATAIATMTAGTTVPPSGPTTVDPRNNPAVIYPHPVPFLSSGPKLHMAHSISSAENDNSALTLPPNIVIAGGGEQMLARPTEDGGREQNNNGEKQQNGGKEHGHLFGNVSQSANENGEEKQKWEQFELSTNNANELERNSAEIIVDDGKFIEGKFEEESAISVGNNSRQKGIGKPLPTAVIAICMSTVGVVMFAVFVGMCVAKKRQMRTLCSGGRASDLHSLQHSPNSNAYMSAAVAARAAQLNGLIYSSAPIGGERADGTMPMQQHTLQRGGAMCRSRSNSASGGATAAMPMSRMTPSQEDIYGWIYSQHAYNSYAK